VAWFSPAWRRRVEGLIHLLSIGFFGLLVVHGIPMVERTMRQFSSAIRIPMGYIYAAVPVGAALVLLFAVEQLVRLRAPAPGAGVPPSVRA
jgi:TRAP-type C4-dicarboxylate transport system permease small subunit